MFLIEDGQLLDFGQRKAQFLSLLNEDEVFHVRISEKAETAFAARRLLDQSDLLIEANRINAELGPLRNFADLNALRHEIDHPDKNSIDTGVHSRVNMSARSFGFGATVSACFPDVCVVRSGLERSPSAGPRAQIGAPSMGAPTKSRSRKLLKRWSGRGIRTPGLLVPKQRKLSKVLIFQSM